MILTLNWENSKEYLQIITDFEMMKNTFLRKGIPIIIKSSWCLYIGKKKIESIREYLFVVFSFSSDFNGIMYTSNKKFEI